MKELFSKILFLSDRIDRIKIILLFILILSGTFFELLGLGSILPFLFVVSKPGLINENFYLNKLYNWISPGSVNNFLIWLGLIIIIVFTLKNAYLFFIQYSIIKFSTKIHQKLSSRLFRCYLYSPYTFHLQRNSAQLLRNLGIVQTVINGILIPLITIITNLLLIVSIFIMLVFVDITSSLIVFSFLGLISFIYFSIFKRKLSRFGEELNYHYEMLFKQFNQGLGSIKESKILGREHFFDKSYSYHLVGLNKILNWQQSIGVLPNFIIETLMVTLILFIMFFAIFRGHEINTILISVSFFGLAAIRLMPSINKINSSVNLIKFYIPGLEEVFSDLKMSESYTKTIPFQKIESELIFNKELELRQIYFSYDGTDKTVLENISLKISKNSTVGFVGKSGAGKTTTVDIILGLLNPNSGKVLVDGFDIHENIRSWQSKVGYIPQQIYLMDETITANIAFGIPENEVNLSKIQIALSLAQLDEFVSQLPNGLNTIIGESGVRVSGGQRQRIGIARALYNEPELLIMDEATAALDNETEKAFMEAIESLSGKRTIIIIAHRLTTVANVDKIFFFSQGKLNS
ncbi:MAG: ABC transporter ATP-binding protein, partial [Parachlamydiaceae bacterium]|nr:ABC transporter ATP-binding protein [Parachlamydiaceae bacterium]